MPLPGSEVQEPYQRHRWKLLGVLGLVELVLVLDGFIVNVALPTVERDLGMSDIGREWVIAGAALATAGLLPLGGRITDSLGPRRTLLVAIWGFGVASAAAGAAVNGAMLIVARCAQGAFAAMLLPAASAMLVGTFALGRERSSAFGIWGMIGAAGGAVGMLLGGVLTEYLSWRGTMYVNLVFVVAILAGLRLWARREDPRHRTELDTVATATMTVGLLAVVYGVSRAGEAGWGERWTLVSIVGGLALSGVFILLQRRARDPLVPLAIFRDRDRAGAQLALFAVGLGSIGEYLYLNYYLQYVDGYTAVQAGAAYIPYIGVQVITTAVVLRFTGAVAGPRVLVSGGLAVSAAGMMVLGFIDPDTPYVACVLPGMTLIGIGFGMLFAVSAELSVRNVPPQDVGIAAAVASAIPAVGSSVGTALLGTIATSMGDGSLGVIASARGYTATFWVSAALLGVGAAASLLILRRGPLHPARPAVAGTPLGTPSALPGVPAAQPASNASATPMRLSEPS